MNAWMQGVISLLEFVPMIILSFVLFRQKIQPHLKGMACTSLAAGILGAYMGPLTYIAGIFVLFCGYLKFRPAAALLVSLSGYTLAVIVTTGVIITSDLTGVVAFSAVTEDLLVSRLMSMLTFLANLAAAAVIVKFRWGFTFLAHYSKLTFCRENIGCYGFMLVVIVGIVFRDTLPVSMLDAVMPFQMLSMATVLFIYMTLRKELWF